MGGYAHRGTMSGMTVIFKIQRVPVILTRPFDALAVGEKYVHVKKQIEVAP